MSSSHRNLLVDTFDHVERLYSRHGLRPGRLQTVAVKPGWTAVIGTEGQCGAAMNFTGWEASFGPERLDTEYVRSQVGRSLIDVARTYLAAESWQERAIGAASLSGLSQPLLTPDALRTRGYEARDGSVDFSSMLRADDVVAMVGFGGGVKRLLGRCREIHVTDMRPPEAFLTLVINQDVRFAPAEVSVHPPQHNSRVLSGATAVAITGSALVNGTMGELLSYCRNARVVCIYGASAGMIPDVLLDAGATVVHSHRVTDPERFAWGAVNDLHFENVIQSTQSVHAISKADP